MFRLCNTGRGIAARSTGWGWIAALVLVFLATSVAFCDAPTAMAPPVPGAPDQQSGTDSDSVFQWTEVPQNQQVPVSRAVFDQNGYQLYDTVGETIVVPFTNQDLYVMKFALSDTGDMYFVNTGAYPVLYVPQNGYLENAAVAGAKWYPFSDSFHPAQPVFLGVAPSWRAFIGMGWYPSMVIYGGYWGHTAFVAGGLFLPTIGLDIVIGGHPYHNWNGYHQYVVVHPGGFYHGPHFAGPAHTFRGAIGHGGPGGPSGPGSHALPEFGGHGHSFGGGAADHGGSIGHSFRGTRDMVHGGHSGGSHGDSGGHGDHSDHGDHH